MSRRISSTSSAVPGSSSRSSIRHRSGAFSPRPNADGANSHPGLRRRVSPSESEHSERTARTIKVEVEDTDDAEHTQPTVVLIRKSRVSERRQGRFKALPGLPFEGPSDSQSRDLREGLSHLLDAPEADEARETSASSSRRVEHDHEYRVARPPQPERGASDTSKQSRLPTPNYPDGPGLYTKVGRGLSYFSRMPSLRTRPQAASRTESETSTYSYTSEGSTAISHTHSHPGRGTSSHYAPSARGRVPAAIKDKRPLLVSKFSTSDKFTQKFPRPRAMRGLTVSDVRAPTILEEGEDIVIERIDRWTLHKWSLVVSVCTVFVYGTAGLACAVLTFFRAWPGADVMYVADYDLLILLTLASSILLLTFLVGLSGALLNSRPLLAIYALLLWPALFALLALGYPSYKRYAFALDRKLSLAWSEWYTPLGRQAVQDALACCGFANALHEAVPSARCYPRSPLPGCKGPLWRFERDTLATVWSTVFALVPLHIVNIFVALLCANHVTRTFGKGITPKRYRLNAYDVRADAEVLMRAMGGLRPVARPGFARAPSSAVFREDKAYYDKGADRWDARSKASSHSTSTSRARRR